MADGESFMKSFANSAIKFVDDIGNFTYGEELTKLRSNKAINPIGKFILGESDTGLRGVAKGVGEANMGLGSAIKSAYTKNGLGESLNYKAIAGTYVGASLAGRVATGGGIYRDSNGNVNLPGVPFLQEVIKWVQVEL